MITGDNPLTACHVAKELKITNKEMMILQPSEGVWFWETINSDITHPYEQDRQYLLALEETYQFCLTGPVSCTAYCVGVVNYHIGIRLCTSNGRIRYCTTVC